MSHAASTPSLQSSDRRHAAVLALAVLAWGLAVAPLLHQLQHAGGQSGHGHSHRGPALPSSQHGAGSLEHLQAVAQFTAPQLVLVVVWFAVSRVAALAPTAPFVAGLTSPAMPQGP